MKARINGKVVICLLGLLVWLWNDGVLRKITKSYVPATTFFPSLADAADLKESACNVLIETSLLHIDLVESIVAQYEFNDSATSANECNRSSYHFHVHISVSSTAEQARNAPALQSWEYYVQQLHARQIFHIDSKGISRRLIPPSLSTKKVFHYAVRTVCDECNSTSQAWISKAPTRRSCFFVAVDEEGCSLPTDASFVPMHFSDPHIPTINDTRVDICIIQQAQFNKRIESFLWTMYNLAPHNVRFHHFHDSSSDRLNSRYPDRYQRYSLPMNFLEYSAILAGPCDAFVSITSSARDVSVIKTVGLAMSRNKPLVIHQEHAYLLADNIGQSHSAVRFHQDEGTFVNATHEMILEQLAQLKRTSTKTSAKWKTPCHVLIINHHVAYHYFLLESILADYPLPTIETCDELKIKVTIVFMKGKNAFQRERGMSWKSYADSVMRNKVYRDETTGQERILFDVMGSKALPNEPFHYMIDSTCRCINSTQEFLDADPHNFCVFHERCPQLQQSPQAMWLSPMHSRFFFPNRLPLFHDERHRPSAKHNLCVIGHPQRRNYELLATYFNRTSSRRGQISNATIQIHNLGWGKLPKCIGPFQYLMNFYEVAGFEEYQRLIYDLCDGILSLLSKSTHPYYFPDDEQKLTGIVCHASAYQKPLLIHQELADLYQPFLGNATVVAHNDSQNSFDKAMDEFIVELK